jgi:hypothetical protein
MALEQDGGLDERARLTRAGELLAAVGLAGHEDRARTCRATGSRACR